MSDSGGINRILLGGAGALVFILGSIAIMHTPVSTATSRPIDESYFSVRNATYPDNAEIKIRWMISHQPERYFLEAAKTFKSIVEEKSGGAMTVEIVSYREDVPEELLPDQRDSAHELLASGDVDIMQAYVKEEILDAQPELFALGLPLLFRDYEHIDEVVDGPIGDRLLSGFDGSPYTGLAFTFSGGYLSFFSNTAAITNLESLRGKTISEHDLPAYHSLYEKLGMTIADIPPASADIRNAVYNDFFGGSEELYGDGESGKSFLHSRHAVLFTVLLANADFFASLTDEQQSIVRDAAKEAARTERREIQYDEARLRDSQEQSWVHDLSPADQNSLREIAEIMKSELTPNLGRGIVDQIENLD